MRQLISNPIQRDLKTISRVAKVTSTGKIKDTTLRLRAKFGDDSSQQSVKDGDLTRADYTLEWPSNHMFKRDHCIHMSRVVEIGRGLGNNAPDVLHVRGVRALNHFHILTFSCLNYVKRISLISLTHATNKSLEKLRVNANAIMTKTRTPTLEHRYFELIRNKETIYHSSFGLNFVISTTHRRVDVLLRKINEV